MKTYLCGTASLNWPALGYSYKLSPSLKQIPALLAFRIQLEAALEAASLYLIIREKTNSSSSTTILMAHV